jgi:tetratricopeptide (TPR) repeat protein
MYAPRRKGHKAWTGLAVFLFFNLAVPHVLSGRERNLVTARAPAHATQSAAEAQTNVAAAPVQIQEVKPLERRIDDLQSNLQWFGFLIALVGIGFGSLITVTVVFFALRTEKTAVAAAKEELRASRSEIDLHVSSALTASTRAEDAAREIDTYRRRAEERSVEIETAATKLRDIVEKVSVTAQEGNQQSKLTEEERNTLNAAASDLHSVPVSELTAQQFKILITEASQSEDWDRMRDLSSAMRLFHQDERSVARSLLNEAQALINLGEVEKSVPLLSEIVRRFSTSKQREVRNLVELALYNKAYSLSRLGLPEEALVEYSTLLDGPHEDDGLPHIRARAFCNRAILFIDSRDYDKALVDADAGLELVGSNVKGSMLEPALKLPLTKSSALEEAGRISDAISVLDNLIRRFSRNQDSVVKTVVSDARDRRKRLRAKQAGGRNK